ncbi:MAG: GNAT family N-acetyltransferase [Bacteroidales bacterium]|nr:GNAT family N-acetyltransferase [Bacteroidales bacterium]
MYIEHSDFCLRSINNDDAEAYYEIYSHPEVARYDDYKPISREDLRVDMARIALYTPASPYRELAVATTADNKMMGVLTIDKKRRYVYLGYHFHPDFQGKGFAVRSVRALLQSFTPQQRQLLRLVSHPENRASLALAQKVGFVFVDNRWVKGVREVVFRYDEEQWASMQAVSRLA